MKTGLWGISLDHTEEGALRLPKVDTIVLNMNREDPTLQNGGGCPQGLDWPIAPQPQEAAGRAGRLKPESHLNYFTRVFRGQGDQNSSPLGSQSRASVETCRVGLLKGRVVPPCYRCSHPFFLSPLCPDHVLFYLHSGLLSLTTVTMPRRKKGKRCTSKKRRQAQHGTQDLRGTQVTATTTEAHSSSSSPGPGVDAKGKPGARSGKRLKRPREALATTTVPEDVSPTRSSKRATGEIGKTDNSSQAPLSNVRSGKRSLTRPAYQLVQFLLRMYKTKKPIRKVHMLKIIDKKYKNRFLRILKRASETMKVLFGTDVKKDNNALSLSAR